MATNYKKTEAAVQAILTALENGATRTAAAAMGGVSLNTMTQWKNDDLEFLEAITRAEGVAEANMAQKLYDAASQDWRAAESWLKRRKPNEWGDNVAVRADKEAQRIIAEMLGESPAGDTGDTETTTV